VGLGAEIPTAGGKRGVRRCGDFYRFFPINTHFKAYFGLNFCLKQVFKYNCKKRADALPRPTQAEAKAKANTKAKACRNWPRGQG